VKQEILAKLKTTEDEVARRVEQARERATETLRQARVRADEVRRQAEEDARRDQKTQLEAERARLAQEREQVLADGRKREDQVRARFQTQVDAHVKKAVDVFTRSMNA
jgi:V/A-type H+/Na+-transporting ATPase subunit G/H